MMEVLGYQLIKIDSTHYDATVLAKYVLFNEGKLILESIE